MMSETTKMEEEEKQDLMKARKLFFDKSNLEIGLNEKTLAELNERRQKRQTRLVELQKEVIFMLLKNKEEPVVVTQARDQLKQALQDYILATRFSDSMTTNDLRLVQRGIATESEKNFQKSHLRPLHQSFKVIHNFIVAVISIIKEVQQVQAEPSSTEDL